MLVLVAVLFVGLVPRREESAVFAAVVLEGEDSFEGADNASPFSSSFSR